MKLTLFKTLMFTLYFITVAIVWSTPGMFDGFSLLVVTFTLAYCGIIVLSQLGSALVALFRWGLANNYAGQEKDFTSSSVVFETETEAT